MCSTQIHEEQKHFHCVCLLKYQNTQHSAPKWHSVLIYYLPETLNKSRCVFVHTIIHATEKKMGLKRKRNNRSLCLVDMGETFAGRTRSG